MNTRIQATALNIHDGLSSIEMLTQTIVNLREKANDFWCEVVTSAEQLELMKSPSVPRLHRVPRRLQHATCSGNTDNGDDQHIQQNTPELFHRKIYLEVIDTISSALCSRFETEAKDILQAVENFLVHNSGDALNYICAFYGSDLDKARLALHRDMFVDIVGASEKYTFETFIRAFKEDGKFMGLLPELHKLLRLVLTIPITTCSAERSFSALRRLKTFLRSTMGQRRLNSAALLNVHKDLAVQLNLNKLANEFILRSTVRRNTFSVVDMD